MPARLFVATRRLAHTTQCNQSARHAAAARLPTGNDFPAHLENSKLPGNFGFDPLGLGADPERLTWFAESERVHARWAMLGVAGILIQVRRQAAGSTAHAALPRARWPAPACRRQRRHSQRNGMAAAITQPGLASHASQPGGRSKCYSWSSNVSRMRAMGGGCCYPSCSSGGGNGGSGELK